MDRNSHPLNRRRALGALALAPIGLRSMLASSVDPRHEAIRRAVARLEAARVAFLASDATLLDLIHARVGDHYDAIHAFEDGPWESAYQETRAAWDGLMEGMAAAGVKGGAVICGGRLYVGNWAETVAEDLDAVIFDSALLLDLDSRRSALP